MKATIYFLFITLILGASTFSNKKLNPIIKEPQMPGTTVPIEDLRTSPNPTPAENESEKFRGTLHSSEQEEQQESPKKKTTIETKKSFLEQRQE